MRSALIALILIVLIVPLSAQAGPQLRTIKRHGYAIQLQGRAKQAPVAAMRAQREQVSTFLGKVHKGMHGRAIGMFDRVVIKPRSGLFGRTIKLDVKDRTLVVRPRVNPLTGKLSVVSAGAIERAWDRGSALGLVLPVGKKAKAWRLLNPVGTPRVLLRNAIASSGKELGGRIDQIVSGKGSLRQLKGKLTALVDEFARQGQPGANGKGSLVLQARTQILKASRRPQLERFAASWKGFVGNADNWSAMTDAAMGQQRPNDFSVKQFQLLGVQFQNHKRVDVNVQINSSARQGHLSAFMPKAPLQEQKRPGRVLRQFQLVGVQVLPVDDISVQLRVDAGRGLNTAGLQHALHGLR